MATSGATVEQWFDDFSPNHHAHSTPSRPTREPLHADGAPEGRGVKRSSINVRTIGRGVGRGKENPDFFACTPFRKHASGCKAYTEAANGLAQFAQRRRLRRFVLPVT